MEKLARIVALAAIGITMLTSCESKKSRYDIIQREYPGFEHPYFALDLQDGGISLKEAIGMDGPSRSDHIFREEYLQTTKKLIQTCAKTNHSVKNTYKFAQERRSEYEKRQNCDDEDIYTPIMNYMKETIKMLNSGVNLEDTKKYHTRMSIQCITTLENRHNTDINKANNFVDILNKFHNNNNYYEINLDVSDLTTTNLEEDELIELVEKTKIADPDKIYTLAIHENFEKIRELIRQFPNTYNFDEYTEMHKDKWNTEFMLHTTLTHTVTRTDTEHELTWQEKGQLARTGKNTTEIVNMYNLVKETGTYDLLGKTEVFLDRGLNIKKAKETIDAIGHANVVEISMIIDEQVDLNFVKQVINIRNQYKVPISFKDIIAYYRTNTTLSEIRMGCVYETIQQ